MSTDSKALTPPRTVLISFACWLLSVVLGVVSSVVSLVTIQAVSTNQQVSTSDVTTVTDTQASSAALTVSIVSVAVVALVFAALTLLFAFKLKAGRNWARVTLTVLTVLDLISLFTVGGTVVGYISSAIQLVAVVLSFLPDSNAYVAARKAGRLEAA